MVRLSGQWEHTHAQASSFLKEKKVERRRMENISAEEGEGRKEGKGPHHPRENSTQEDIPTPLPYLPTCPCLPHLLSGRKAESESFNKILFLPCIVHGSAETLSKAWLGSVASLAL